MKTSSRKVRKQEGSEDQDQEVGSIATTGVSVQKGKRRRVIKSSSSHDTAQTTEKDSCDNSVESLRGKRQKQVGASVVRREGLRRSSRASAKEHLDETSDGTVSLTDTGASEETPGSHTEIKAMVRDILFKEIIDREHDAEMAYVDEVINGICNSTMDSINMSGNATASTKFGQGNKNGTGVEGKSSNATQGKGKLDQASEGAMQVTSLETRNHTTKNGSVNPLKEVIGTTPVS